MELILVGILGFVVGGALFGQLGKNKLANVRDEAESYLEAADREFDRVYSEMLAWKAKAQKKKLPVDQ